MAAAASQTRVRFCTACGEPVDAEGRFCAECGEPVKPRATLQEAAKSVRLAAKLASATAMGSGAGASRVAGSQGRDAWLDAADGSAAGLFGTGAVIGSGPVRGSVRNGRDTADSESVASSVVEHGASVHRLRASDIPGGAHGVHAAGHTDAQGRVLEEGGLGLHQTRTGSFGKRNGSVRVPGRVGSGRGDGEGGWVAHMDVDDAEQAEAAYVLAKERRCVSRSLWCFALLIVCAGAALVVWDLHGDEVGGWFEETFGTGGAGSVNQGALQGGAKAFLTNGGTGGGTLVDDSDALAGGSAGASGAAGGGGGSGSQVVGGTDADRQEWFVGNWHGTGTCGDFAVTTTVSVCRSGFAAGTELAVGSPFTFTSFVCGNHTWRAGDPQYLNADGSCGLYGCLDRISGWFTYTFDSPAEVRGDKSTRAVVLYREAIAAGATDTLRVRCSNGDYFLKRQGANAAADKPADSTCAVCLLMT